MPLFSRSAAKFRWSASVKGQVRVQRTVQLHLGLFCDLGAGQHKGTGQVCRHAEIFGVHIVKRLFHAGKVGQLVGHFGEADTAAKDHQFLAIAVQCQCGIVVDLLDDFHTARSLLHCIS